MEITNSAHFVCHIQGSFSLFVGRSKCQNTCHFCSNTVLCFVSVCTSWLSLAAHICKTLKTCHPKHVVSDSIPALAIKFRDFSQQLKPCPLRGTRLLHSHSSGLNTLYAKAPIISARVSKSTTATVILALSLVLCQQSSGSD